MKGYAKQNSSGKTEGRETFTKPSKEQIIKQAFKFHSQGNLLDAAKNYQYLIDQDFNNPLIYANYGAVLQSLGKLQEAEKSTRRAIELKADFAEAYFNLGNILRDLGKLQEAESSHRKSIELKPSFAEAHGNLGNILKDLGKLKEAEISLLKAIQLNPNFIDAYYNLGNILADLGKLKKAEISLLKAIQLNPNFAEAYSNLGSVLISLGRLQESEIAIRKAIELNPNFAEAYANLGGILRDLGNLKEAELSTRKAIKINPIFAEAYSTLGSILRDLGKLKEAKSSNLKAIELKNDMPIAYRELSICVYLLEDTELALKYIEKANYLDPKDINNQLLFKTFLKRRNRNNRDIKIYNDLSQTTEHRLDSNPLILDMPVEANLVNSLYKIKARDQEKYQSPTYGDAKGSDYKLFEINNPIIKKIKEKLTSISQKSVKSEILISESFFTIFRSGGGLKSHNHLSTLDKVKGLNIASQKYSLVYYLSVGEQNSSEPGILKLENPNQDILPHNGLIIIFPADRNHSIFYKGKKDRIIIGVNFYRI